MASLVRNRSQLDAIDQVVVDLVEKFGFRWHFDYERDLPTLRVQVRDEEHNAPKALVTRMATAIRNGDPIPAIVVTTDNWMVDGNTRGRALAERLRMPKFKAIVLDVEYETASAATKGAVHALGAAFNLKNGKGISPKETQDAVEQLVARGDMDATRIAAMLGVTSNTVHNHINEREARKTAERLGVNLNGSVVRSNLRTLGRAASKINDVSMRELMMLVQDSGMRVGDVSDLIKRVQSQTSDEAALAVIREERENRAEQIQQYALTGKAQPIPAAQLRQDLGFLLSHHEEQTINLLVEYNPALRSMHLTKVDAAIVALQRLRELQAQVAPQ